MTLSDNTAELLRSSLRDPPHWPAFVAIGVVVALAVLWWRWWIWLPAQPFELHLEPPVAVNPTTGQERTRWERGDTLGIRYTTRILRDCPATYERWMRRADGLAYGPAHLGQNHAGHYLYRDSPEGRSFTVTVTLPAAMQPGEYAYQPRAISHCSPVRARIEDAPPVMIEVR